MPIGVTAVVLAVRSNRLVPDDAAVRTIVVAGTAVLLALVASGSFLLWVVAVISYQGP